MSSRLATLADLQSVYSLEDLYNLVEIINVDAHNRRVVEKAASKKGA